MEITKEKKHLYKEIKGIIKGGGEIKKGSV
jgi:hypothetical protein